MPSRFERYRVVDGTTPLAARYFNPVFQDLDLRLASLEEVRISWDTAVKEVVKFGLVRIDELITEPLREVADMSTQAQHTSTQLEQLRQLAQDRTASLTALIDSLQKDTADQIAAFTNAAQNQIGELTNAAGVDIATWKAARTAELDAWVAAFNAQINTALADIGATIASLPQLQRSARTANTTLVKADNGKLIDITDGSFVQTISAAAALGAGWWCWLRNAGTGDITLDANGEETIDGRTSYVMYPGEMRLVQCDGTALRTVVLNSFYRVWASSADFIKPPGYKRFTGYLWGAGSSGRKSSSGSACGGPGGAWAPIDVPSDSLANTVQIVIGTGGPPVMNDNTNGIAGGNSSFGELSAPGGAAAVSSASPGASSRFADGTGGPNTTGAVPSITAFGGGGGGPGLTGSSVAGGRSIYGGHGGAGNDATSGEDGMVPGGGGGGTKTGPKSGAGARGEMRLRGVF